MDVVPNYQIEKGTFLIASPDVEDSFFSRSVVLICEHNEQGSFGLIINKDIELDLPEEIVNFEQLQNPHVEIKSAGPLNTIR